MLTHSFALLAASSAAAAAFAGCDSIGATVSPQVYKAVTPTDCVCDKNKAVAADKTCKRCPSGTTYQTYAVAKSAGAPAAHGRCIPKCAKGQAFNEFESKCYTVPVWKVGPASKPATAPFDMTTWAPGATAGTFEMKPHNYPTTVKLSHDSKGLKVDITAHNDAHRYNNYKGCNVDLWNHEVLEVFIVKGSEPQPERYWEFQVTPNGDKFIKHIYNQYGDRSLGLAGEWGKCSQFTATATKNATGNSWSASFHLPYSTIGKSDVYRGNVYRYQINDAKKIIQEGGDCDIPQCSYLGANIPKSKNPNFHNSAHFATWEVKN